MWNVLGSDLIMCEEDYGIQLPITITGATFAQYDEMQLTIKDTLNGNTILTKTFSNITDNTVDLELTAAESALLPVGNYVYRLDWYQNGSFMCNVIPLSKFRVVEKA